MKPYEFMRMYHPLMGRFVYKHKGSGLIIDNIFKPLKKVAGIMTKSVLKPLAKKALQSGISHAGDKLGKKAASTAIEKSGDIIRQRLASKFKTTTPSLQKQVPKQESTDVLINRLISGSGIKRRRKIM